MKVFLDTNVVLEGILQREQYAVSKQIVKYMVAKILQCICLLQDFIQ